MNWTDKQLQDINLADQGVLSLQDLEKKYGLPTAEAMRKELDYLKCGKCGASHINELRDGRDLIELALTATAIDGYEPVYDPPQQKQLLCAYCMQELVRPLIDVGFPAWWVHGWKNEADALTDGWDPQNPYVNPFAEQEL